MKPTQIVCSYKLFEYCLARYSKTREVFADKYVEHNDFYYMNRAGKVRVVVYKTQVWIEDPKWGWPYIVRRRG